MSRLVICLGEIPRHLGLAARYLSSQGQIPRSLQAGRTHTPMRMPVSMLYMSTLEGSILELRILQLKSNEGSLGHMILANDVALERAVFECTSLLGGCRPLQLGALFLEPLFGTFPSNSLGLLRKAVLKASLGALLRALCGRRQRPLVTGDQMWAIRQCPMRRTCTLGGR